MSEARACDMLSHVQQSVYCTEVTQQLLYQELLYFYVLKVLHNRMNTSKGQFSKNAKHNYRKATGYQWSKLSGYELNYIVIK